MKAKRFLFSAFFVLMLHFSTPVDAQQGSGLSLFKEYPLSGKTPQLGLQAGTMFAAGPMFGTMLTHSLAPSFNWDIGKRFNLELGTILSSSYMHGRNHLFPFTPHMAGGESMEVLAGQQFLSSTFYAAGAYQVNPRLSLIGSTWTERNNLPGADMHPQATGLNQRGATFGFDYRMSANFSFGAQVGISKGYNPWSPLYQGFNRKNYHDHFFHSPVPFHKGSRW